MGSDGEYYEIRRNPYLYACYILTFCSELMLDSATEESERNLSRGENYPDRLCFVSDETTREYLELFCDKFVSLFRGIKEKRVIFSNINEEIHEQVSHENLLKIMARLEYYGHYIRCPWDIIVGEESRLMSLEGLSSFARTVIRNVLILRKADGTLDGPFFNYGRYNPVMRCFE